MSQKKSARTPRPILWLVASLWALIVAATVVSSDARAGEPLAGAVRSVQEPESMFLVGLALLGLAFSARHSGKNTSKSASQ